MNEFMDFKIGQILTLKKPHPCGNYEWLVIRIGMDIGIKCVNCGHRVLLKRRDLERRVRTVSSST
ncbi:DUF951 domain-containing protein [SAR202 cluster bacterium AD-802-E10_MRT_200m]|nr:DUF951 domain-containing protein [SAR202 cluster bacterium AD-802-E10_MRT_200m]